MKPNPRYKLGSKNHMRETLNLAYQHVLDNVMGLGFPKIFPKRLTPEQEKELGRRLSQYWNLK